MVSSQPLLVILTYILIKQHVQYFKLALQNQRQADHSSAYSVWYAKKMAHDLMIRTKSDVESLTCWLFSQNRLSCVLSLLGSLSGAGATQRVKTKLQKQKHFHYLLLYVEKYSSPSKGHYSFPCITFFLCWPHLKQRLLLFLEMPLTALQGCQ